jgi:hypothetical protein
LIRGGVARRGREEVAALVHGLVVAFVLPRFQQRVGDVLLLDGELVDDQVGETRVAVAVGARARDLVGPCRAGASCSSEFFFGFSFLHTFFFFFA